MKKLKGKDIKQPALPPPDRNVWDGMTERQFKTLCEYLHNAANTLLLQNWEIRIKRQPCNNPEAAAQVWVDWGCRSAHIEVSATWNGYTRERKRQYVAHELLHLYERPIFDVIEKAVRNATGELGWNMLEPGIHLQRELMVDSLSFVIAERLPEYPE